MFWRSWFRDSRRTLAPCLKASKRMPSSLRSKTQSGPVNRSWVSVAAIGSIHSGNSLAIGNHRRSDHNAVAPLCLCPEEGQEMLERSSIKSPEDVLQNYYKDLEALDMAPLWTNQGGGGTEPHSKVMPFRWRWQDMRPQALRALALVG